MTTRSPILDRYGARTPRSAAAATEAARWLPGGDTRSTAWFSPYPPFIAEGRGYELVDVDGNRYIDLLNNYTVLLHGHAPARVVEALRRQAPQGFVFAAAHESQAGLAKLLCERLPSVERVRFTNSGTEAVMTALRLARAYTGRPLVAKLEGGYHGTWDQVQVSVSPNLDAAGPPDRPVSLPDSAGLAPGTIDSLLVLPSGDLEAARAILEPRAEEVACLIVEPMQGVGGTVPFERSYLEGLRNLTRRLGALLVFDEIITLRLSLGGAQAMLAVTPDLTTIGKIIGGGLPVGAVGGRADVMELFDPSRPGALPHGGSFNGNPLTMVAGLANLEHLTAADYERLNGLGDRLREGVNALAEELGLAVCATGLGSLLTIHMLEGPVRGVRDARRADPELSGLVQHALLNEGVFIARRGMACASTAMDEETVDRALEAIRRALSAVDAERPIRALAAAGAQPA